MEAVPQVEATPAVRREPVVRESIGFRAGFRTKVDPAAAALRIEEIRRRLVAELKAFTPHHVLDDARDPDSPLHNHFEWDDTTAAEQHRLQQARTLINGLRIIRIEEKGRTFVPIYTSVQPTATAERQFVLVEEAVENPQTRKQLLRDAIERLYTASCRMRETGLHELQTVFDAIDDAREQLNDA